MGGRQAAGGEALCLGSWRATERLQCYFCGFSSLGSVSVVWFLGGWGEGGGASALQIAVIWFP